MKKLLLGIITILLLVLCIVTVINGMKIGNLTILGFEEIKTKDENLDTNIKEATKLASTDYQKSLSDLETAKKALEAEKKSYEDMVNVSTDSEVQAASQSYTYTIDMLYIRIENHAKAEGVNLKIDVVKNQSGTKDVYNLNFTANGSYVQIEEFITDIEDDSKLGFKIEDFKMTPSSTDGSEVQATFSCKEITITGLSSTSSTSSSSKN